jgi:hypothetical protein
VPKIVCGNALVLAQSRGIPMLRFDHHRRLPVFMYVSSRILSAMGGIYYVCSKQPSTHRPLALVFRDPSLRRPRGVPLRRVGSYISGGLSGSSPRSVLIQDQLRGSP